MHTMDFASKIIPLTKKHDVQMNMRYAQYVNSEII
jgi:hypothetical protein